METQREIQKNATVYNFDTIDVDGKPEVSFKCLKRLVGERGFEPPTPWSRTRCSTRLSHSPTVRVLSITDREIGTSRHREIGIHLIPFPPMAYSTVESPPSPAASTPTRFAVGSLMVL